VIEAAITSGANFSHLEQEQKQELEIVNTILQLSPLVEDMITPLVNGPSLSLEPKSAIPHNGIDHQSQFRKETDTSLQLSL
jgi:hypothetical protein